LPPKAIAYKLADQKKSSLYPKVTLVLAFRTPPYTFLATGGPKSTEED
jgi:hypothetical protein